MDDQTTLIVTALIAAFAGLLVAFITSWWQSKLEYRKWNQSRQDELDKEYRAAIAELARKIAVASHRIIWLTWKAKHDPTGLKEADIAGYDTNISETFPDIVGARILVSAFNRQVHEEISPFVGKLYELDERVAHAAKTFRSFPKQSVEQLIELHDEVVEFDNLFLQKFTNIADLVKK